jgi:hypothetical protein
VVAAFYIRRLSQAIEQIEKWLKQNRPLKVVAVRCGVDEDGNAALNRHYAAYPEDRDADIVIFKFCDDDMADEGYDPPQGHVLIAG